MSGAYKKDSVFNPLKLGRLKTEEDKVKALEELARQVSDISFKANKEFERVQSAKGAGGSTVIIAGGSSSSGSGGGGSTSLLDLGFRSGKQAILAAGTDISFSRPMATGDFILGIVGCYVTQNPMRAVRYNILNVSVTGFRIVPLENSTVEWFVMPKT